MKKAWMYLPILLAVFVFHCQPSHKYVYQEFVIGAMSEVTFYCDDDTLAQHILSDCNNELKRLHKLLNRFSDSSMVSQLNTHYHITAPVDIIDLFELSDSISCLTDGLFDISVAPYVELWGFYEHEYRAPDSEQINALQEYIDYKKIKVVGDTIHIEPGMKLDLGGIAQGYAADRVAMILKAYHIESALVNIGGEIVAIGRSPEKRPWKIGIKHPRGSGIIETLDIQDQALSTSGDYEKYFIVEGQRLPHIINPLTGFPSRDFASVTIISASAAYADALATAIAVMGPEKGLAFLDSCGIRGIIYYESNGNLVRVENP